MSSSLTSPSCDDHDDDVWSLSVKAIGSALKHCDLNDSDNDQQQQQKQKSVSEKNFTVTVSPDDAVTSLYDQIEGITGLKAHEQRLIYRGRLLPTDHPSTKEEEETNNKNEKEPEPKIKDIPGLADGHTIHLVKREGSSSSGAAEENASSSSASAETTVPLRGPAEGLSSSGSSLFGALMGMEDDTNTATSSTTTSPTATSRRWRGSRLGRSRRPHYRLTAEDLQPADPGSLEPVRQSLMTLHTMLPHASVVSQQQEEDQQQPMPSPLDSNRVWYRGQWIDCRDTVNEWLEATILDIVQPADILPQQKKKTGEDDDEEEEEQEEIKDSQEPPNSSSNSNPQPHQRTLEPATDPAIAANDPEGRQRLLLEPCDIGDEGDLGGELAGFRPRASNAGVQLLLVHYNGWPHRWNEWIRSDSERIRPFRTRTRHPSMSSHSSPSVQTVYNESPSTHIRDEENPIAERSAVLPELSRAVAAINELLSAVAAQENSNNMEDQQSQEQLQQQQPPQPNLPWAVPRAVADTESGLEDLPPLLEDDDDVSSGTDELPPLIPRPVDDDDEPPPLIPRRTISTRQPSPQPAASAAAATTTSSSARLRRRQLELLAPLLDRLGRTLMDAAPHVASLAQAATEVEEQDNNNNNNMDPDTTAESIGSNQAVAATPESEEHNSGSGSNGSSSSTLGGLLSLLGRDRRRTSNLNTATHPITAAANNNVTATAANSLYQEHPWPVDPDYVDFATGIVNTTRGEVRSGPRRRSSNNDDVAGLLGAYLAAASLGLNSSGDSDGSGSNANNDDSGLGNILGLSRLLRERGGAGGGNGGGIDIHIHAVVTAPGMPPATLGAGLGGGVGGMMGLPAGAIMAGNNIAQARDSLATGRERRGSGGSSLLRMRQHPTPVVQQEEDDMGLFDELYSENPAPVDHIGTPEPASSGSNNGNPFRTTNHHSNTSSDPFTRLSHSHTTPPRSSASASRHHSRHEPSPNSRRGVGRSSSGDSMTMTSSSNNASPRHRSSLMGRLFRRSRRSSS